LVFYFSFTNYFLSSSALENVCIPAFIKKTSKNEAEKRAKELLDFLRLYRIAIINKPSETFLVGNNNALQLQGLLVNNPAVHIR